MPIKIKNISIALVFRQILGFSGAKLDLDHNDQLSLGAEPFKNVFKMFS